MTNYYRFFGAGAAILGASFLITAHSANAQQQQQPPAAPEGWFKVCEQDPQLKKEVCAMTFQVKNDKGQPFGTLRFAEVQGVKQKVFNGLIPPGLLIQPGMRIQIDGSNKGTAKYQICTPQVCVVEARLGADIISSMKKGANLVVIGIGQDGKQVQFPATLTGFTAAYDGPPIDPKQLAAASETLQQRLQRRADEARKKLLDQKKEEGEGQ